MSEAPAEAARVAVDADVAAVAALCREAAAEMAVERGGRLLAGDGCPAEPAEVRIRERLVSCADLVGVGTVDDVVVGALLARRTEAAGRPVAAVDVLYVEPAARSIGVGEALVDLLIGWAAEGGCDGVDVPALPGMRETKNFFEGAGFVTRLLVMHRPLAPAGDVGAVSPAAEATVDGSPARLSAPAAEQ